MKGVGKQIPKEKTKDKKSLNENNSKVDVNYERNWKDKGVKKRNWKKRDRKSYRR